MSKPLLNYCLVTQNLASIIEDSITDSDRFPDVSDITGEVIFTPNIANGKAYQLFDSQGNSYTVPVSRIRAKIVNGEVVHEDSPGIYLFAAGVGSNPDKITYTVEYRNLRSGELSFSLSPLKFEAIPGGEVDLTMATPVVGATPTGVVRGPRGAGLESIVVDGSELVFTAADEVHSFEISRIPLDETVRAEADAAADLAADGVRDEVKGIADRAEAAANRADTRVDTAINNGASLIRDKVKDDADRAEAAADRSEDSAILAVEELAAPKEWSTSYEQVIQPESYGALGNNPTADTDALQLALDASAESGLPVVLRNKTYHINKTLRVASGAKLYGTQASTIRPDYGVNVAFEIKGTSSEQIPLTAAANMGEYSIKIGDTSMLAAGDLVRLVSQRVAVSEDADDGWRLGASTADDYLVYFGEFLRVAEVSSAREIVTDGPIVFPGYLPNADAENDPRARTASTVEKVTPVRDVHLRGFKVTGYPSVVANVELGDRVIIEDVTWETLRNVGSFIQFKGSIDCVARNCHVVYPGVETSSYTSRNTFKVISSQNCGFSGCSAVRPTQAFDITFDNVYQTPSLYSFVTECDTQSAIYHGATSHGGTIFSTFQNNRFLNCRSSGLNNRSRSSLIQGNTITSSAIDSNYGIDLRQSGCVDTDVSGNVINGFVVGIAITDTADGLDVPTSWVGARIRGNTIRNFSRDGISMNRQGNTYRGMTGINIEGNQIRGGRTTQSSCVRVDSYVNGVSVRNNHLDGMGTCEALVVSEPNADHLTVEGNTLRRCINYGVLMKARSDSTVPHPTLYVGMGNEIESITRKAYLVGSDNLTGTMKWAKEPFQAYARVTGSVSDGTALSSLISELEKIGIIQDRTT